MMGDTPTPGQICYAAHVHTYCVAGHPCWPAFADIPPLTQRAWENAAQAVLAQCTPKEDAPHA